MFVSAFISNLKKYNSLALDTLSIWITSSSSCKLTAAKKLPSAPIEQRVVTIRSSGHAESVSMVMPL